MGEKRGREILTRMVISRDEYMRASAAYALGQIRDGRDRSTLIRLLGDPSWLVRKNAVRSLINFGSSDRLRCDDILAALQGNDVAARVGALEVIGALRMGSARGRVISLLEDEAGEVRSKAEEVLDLLDGY
jgi:HEAT repeat protein